jgi:hypothetical protein
VRARVGTATEAIEPGDMVELDFDAGTIKRAEFGETAPCVFERFGVRYTSQLKILTDPHLSSGGTHFQITAYGRAQVLRDLRQFRKEIDDVISECEKQVPSCPR